MSALIHGWRTYSFKRCVTHNEELVIVGQFGMHVHDRESPRAACRGKSSAMWMTPEAKAATLNSGNHDDDCPDFGCTCGFYGYRMFDQVDGGQAPQVIILIAHVTALGKTVLHTEGFRTARYIIDFIVSPRTPNATVMVPKSGTGDPNFSSWGPYWGGAGVESMKIGPAVEEVAARMKVPVLEKDSFNACPDCLVANKWKTTQQIEQARQTARAEQWAREKGT